MPASSSIVDYYAVLGLSRHAGHQEINNAYKKLALLYHPDKAGDDKETIQNFRQIQEAVDVLRSPGQRLEYDKVYDELFVFNPLESQARVNSGRSGRERSRQWEVPSRKHRSTPKDPWFRGMSSQEINQRYMYTHGHSVHMNPTSEESKMETARWVNELKDWEHEWAGIGSEDWTIDPRLPKSSKKSQLGASETQCHRETEEKQEQLPDLRETGCPEQTIDEADMGATAVKERLLDCLEGMADQFKHEEAELQAKAAAEVPARPGEDMAACCKRDEGNMEATAEEERLLNRRDNMEACLEPDEATIRTRGEKWEKTGKETDLSSGQKALITQLKSCISEADVRDQTVFPRLNTSSSVDDTADVSCLHPTFAAGNVLSSHSNPCVVNSIATHKNPAYATGRFISAPANPLSGIVNIVTSHDHVSSADSTSSPHLHPPSSNEIILAPGHNPISADRVKPIQLSSGVDSIVNDNLDQVGMSTSSTEDSKRDEDVFPFPLPSHICQNLTEKLAAGNLHYGVEEYHQEMMGLVITLWVECLEVIRLATGGAPAPLNKPEDCQHAGFWDFELHHAWCGNCSLWRPIIVLQCPGCSVRTCVRCHWLPGSPSAP